MDEAEKYQQRLQAIAEKRRLQEEQDRAKRQLEDEKLRLQQMKRKSLRDQWLMEGPPLSPDSAGPRSPLWGGHAQQIEARIDKLQSEIVEKTHKEEDSTSAQSHAVHHGNGERASAVTPPASGCPANGEEKSPDPPHDASLTNGPAQDTISHSVNVNDINKGAETLLFLGYTEAEPGQGLSNDDEVSAVIRAERVIISEEGQEVTEDSQDRQAEEDEEVEEKEEEKEKEEEENGEEGREEEEAVEEKVEEKEEDGNEEAGEKGQEENREEEREEDEEAMREKEREEKHEEKEDELETEREEEEQVKEREEDNTGDVENRVEVSAESDADSNPMTDAAVKPALNPDSAPDADPAADDERESASAEPRPQSLSATPGGADDEQTPSVSVTLPASALNPNGAQKSADLASPATSAASQFQEIPLDGATVEEEPLLAAKAEPLTDATNPDRAEGAKTKTCQCCSVM